MQCPVLPLAFVLTQTLPLQPAVKSTVSAAAAAAADLGSDPALPLQLKEGIEYCGGKWVAQACNLGALEQLLRVNRVGERAFVMK